MNIIMVIRQFDSQISRWNLGHTPILNSGLLSYNRNFPVSRATVHPFAHTRIMPNWYLAQLCIP